MFWYLLPGAGMEGKDADLVLALGSMVFGLQMLSKKRSVVPVVRKSACRHLNGFKWFLFCDYIPSLTTHLSSSLSPAPWGKWSHDIGPCF